MSFQHESKDVREKKNWQNNADTVNPHKTFRNKLNKLGLTNGKIKAKAQKHNDLVILQWNLLTLLEHYSK